MIIAITPTGGRPEAFALCEKYMARQTMQPDEWIVVDDCDPATSCTMGQVVIRPCSRWNPTKQTQHRNLMAAIDHIKPQQFNVILFEDDDWYAPDYIEKQCGRLHFNELVGEQPARYYHVRYRAARLFAQTRHASLCATAFRSSMLDEFMDLCEQRAWLDTTLWSRYGSRGQLYHDHSVIGIKGMPGREGVSAAHRNIPGPQWMGDPGGDILRQWIGAEDAKVYGRFKADRY